MVRHRITFSFVSLIAFLLGGCNAAPPASQPVQPSPVAVSATPAPPAAAAGTELKATPSGLQYQDLIAGAGPPPLFGQTVLVRYTGWTKDAQGKLVKFDTNEEPHKPILPFKLGTGEVVKGMEIGVGGGRGIDAMRIGGRRKLVIPPDLGYGAEAVGPIPANSTLIFEVQLTGVKGGAGGFGAR